MYLAKEYFVCNSLFHTLWATESRELTPYMSFQTVDPIILFFYWKSFTIFQLPNHQSPSQVCRFCMWTDPGLALQSLFILSWSSVYQSPWAPSHHRSFYHSLVFFFLMLFSMLFLSRSSRLLVEFNWLYGKTSLNIVAMRHFYLAHSIIMQYLLLKSFDSVSTYPLDRQMLRTGRWSIQILT